MSSDGGGGLLKELESGFNDQVDKFKRDPLGQLIKHATNYMTMGTLKYDPKSGLREGSTIRGIDETVGEISGRNKARAEMGRQEENLRKAEAQALKDRNDKLYQDMIIDRQASMAAQAGRAPQDYGRNPFSQKSAFLGSDEDFLGL